VLVVIGLPLKPYGWFACFSWGRIREYPTILAITPPTTNQQHRIFYCSRHDPQKLCVALYEHRIQSADLVTELITTNNLSDQSFSAELNSFLDRYGFENTKDLKNPAI
jgi:hypothetical protein